MILRRFIEHIKEQNWFAVGLDVLVVIVGIFLGMQVTEWNDDRKERTEEKRYLERMLVDAEKSIELQTVNLRSNHLFLKNILDAISVLEADTLAADANERLQVGLAGAGINRLARGGGSGGVCCTGRVGHD